MSSSGPAAVVGAAGFLGGALVRLLDRSGIETVRFTRANPALSADGKPERGLAQARTVYWTASSINPWLAENEPLRVAADRLALARILDALAESGSSARFVLLSSGGTIYDPNVEPPYAEDAPVRPLGAYGKAEAELEALVAAVPGAVRVRVSNAYGPGQPLAPRQGVIGHWLRAVRAGSPIQVFGRLDTSRDYVYVDDICRALIGIHSAPEVPSVLNVGSGTATTLAELVALIRDVCGPVEVVNGPSRGFDVSRSWLEIDLAQRVLDWRPEVRLREGLSATWSWLRADSTR